MLAAPLHADSEIADIAPEQVAEPVATPVGADKNTAAMAACASIETVAVPARAVRPMTAIDP